MVNLNGRARMAVVLALVVPAGVLTWLSASGDEFGDGWGILAVWLLIALVCVAANYLFFAVCALFQWVKCGLSADELSSIATLVRWLRFAAIIGFVAICASTFRYSIVPATEAPVGWYWRFDHWTGNATLAKVGKDNGNAGAWRHTRG
jgi:hypothetical protein